MAEDERFFGVIRTLNEDARFYEDVEFEREKHPFAWVQYTGSYQGGPSTALLMVPMTEEERIERGYEDARKSVAEMRDVQVTHLGRGGTVYEGYVRDKDGERVFIDRYHRERWSQVHPPLGYAPHEHIWVTRWGQDPHCAIQGCPAEAPEGEPS